MRGSCIQHPKREPLIIIHGWQIEACDGDACAAALLSFFEYWHNYKLDQRQKACEANDIAELHGDARTQDESLFQFHTEEQLEQGVLIYKRRAIRESLTLLIKKGFISCQQNPNPRYKFDRTKYFLFHPEVVNEWLNSRSGKNAGSSGKNAGWSGENTSPQGENTRWCGKNAGTITEITSEITSETTTHTHTSDRSANPVGVCAKSKFSLEECLRYAEHLHQTGKGITNPGGYATSIHRSGEADALIDKYLHSAPADAPLNSTECPDCRGTGFWYPAGLERGVARCAHQCLVREHA